MFFIAKLNVYNDFTEKVEFPRLFVCAENTLDATEKICNYYGEGNIEFISLRPFSPDDMLIFDAHDDKARECFETAISILEKDIIW
jgi:hypothetical protein